MKKSILSTILITTICFPCYAATPLCGKAIGALLNKSDGGSATLFVATKGNSTVILDFTVSGDWYLINMDPSPDPKKTCVVMQGTNLLINPDLLRTTQDPAEPPPANQSAPSSPDVITPGQINE